jgi:hypothetical protein
MRPRTSEFKSRLIFPTGSEAFVAPGPPRNGPESHRTSLSAPYGAHSRTFDGFGVMSVLALPGPRFHKRRRGCSFVAIRRGLALLIAAAAVVAIASPAARAHDYGRTAQASEVISPDATASDVNAYRGVVVWSRRAASGRFRLVVRRGGATGDVRLRSFKDPVDADLGPARRGGLVATYERCRSSERCDVFRLGLSRRRERKLGFSTRRRSEFAPSTWRGRYVFARALDASGEPAGSGSGLFSAPPTRRLSRTVFLQSDLRGRVVAVQFDDFDFGTKIAVKRFSRGGRGRVCTVATENYARSFSTSSGIVQSPVMAGDYVYWLHSYGQGVGGPQPTGGATIERRRLPDRRCRSRPQEGGPSVDRDANSLAVDRGTLYYTSGRGVVKVSAGSFAP